jgi:hypothetical protein
VIGRNMAFASQPIWCLSERAADAHIAVIGSVSDESSPKKISAAGLRS